MILIRFILVILIIYLIIRSFVNMGKSEILPGENSKREDGSKINNRGVSKKIGEYVDYEEVKSDQG